MTTQTKLRSVLTGTELTKEDESLIKLFDLIDILDEVIGIQMEEGGDIFHILKTRFNVEIKIGADDA